MQRCHPYLARHRGEVGKVRVDRTKALAILVGKVGSTLDRNRVGIEREDDAVGGGRLQQGAAVATSAKGAVKIAAPGNRRQRDNRFREQNWRVPRLRHRAIGEDERSRRANNDSTPARFAERISG